MLLREDPLKPFIAGRLPFIAGRLIAAAACLPVALACQTEAAPVPEVPYATRDSAGILIAENTGLPSTEDSWVVEAEPYLSIGGVSAAPPAQFTVVTQATRFGDGRLVVLENETSELRFFDAEGEHLRTTGGRGEGPGEFQYASTFARLPGHTLLVEAIDRYISFASNGDYVGEWRIDSSDLIARKRAACSPSALLADGSLFHCAVGRPEVGDRWGSRLVAQLLRATPDGTEVPLGFYVGADEGVLFSSGTWIASGGSPMIVAIVNNPEYSVEVWSPEGRMMRIIRRLDGRRTPTDREVEAAMEMAMRPPPMGPARARPDIPDLVPASFGLTVGSQGDIWIRRAPLRGMQDESLFDAFDQEGRFRGQVRFDGYFWLYEVGDDYLLGARFDEMGVPHIQLHRLVRSSS